MNAYLHGLYIVLGIFIPLIITNCIVLARIEAFAAKNRPAPAMADGAMMVLDVLDAGADWCATRTHWRGQYCSQALTSSFREYKRCTYCQRTIPVY